MNQKNNINWSLIKEPILTEKSLQLAKKNNKYTFKIIQQNNNKLVIKQALENIFDVKILHINIIKVLPKKKNARYSKARKVGFTAGYKKAIITLPKNQKIDLFLK